MSSTSLDSEPLEGWLLAGLVVLVVAVELLLVLRPALGASETVRVALAALVLLVVPTVVVGGVARETLPPAALVVSLPLAVLYAYTGLLLPWTQLSFRLGQLGVELALAVPVVGGDLAGLLFGGSTLGQPTLEHAAFGHRLSVVAGVAAVVAAAVRSRSTSTHLARGDTRE
ncbi:Cytochrome b(N-terminal)/b6/petB [Halogranum gelatinilyticum]|uniref:Cytochrome b(N-terminal)/b6/petB n=1 Tax=Halogranum gelatinilyticum TaxID=660521 RepID=A0A1G9SSF7_9EURY|nr:cytochrome b N-terminal domain-containing protein [Halogranum gelatinilyticum]SDM38362.1 Cytochrome b(N-terminal)/b6/petB [Halogranum gelatinilyticum]